jgi:hypothetical protein
MRTLLLAGLFALSCTNYRVAYDIAIENKYMFQQGVTACGEVRDFEAGIRIHGTTPSETEGSGEMDVPVIGEQDYVTDGERYHFRGTPFLGYEIYEESLDSLYSSRVSGGIELPLGVDMETRRYTVEGEEVDAAVPFFDIKLNVGGYLSITQDVGNFYLGFSTRYNTAKEGGMLWQAGVKF